jgi:hypothetical protein
MSASDFILNKLKQSSSVFSSDENSSVSPVSLSVPPTSSGAFYKITKPAISNKLFSPVPKSVYREAGITTYTLPDGREFKLDDYGKPVVSEREELKEETKTQVRGGSFAETSKEVDHVVPIALGGTNTPSNLQALKSKKTISQTVWDFITGETSEIGDYKPENRQEGKMIVEQKAIRKYQAGEIDLFSAMAAVQNYDDPQLVADFLKEPLQKKESASPATVERGLIPKAFDYLTSVEAGPASQAKDFLKQKYQESRKKGALNEIIGFIGGKRYRDTTDGTALIIEVGENLDAQMATIAREEVRKDKGVPSKEFQQAEQYGMIRAEHPAKQLERAVMFPVRMFVGYPARFLQSVGLEITGSDARFTPQTELKEMFMGKEDVVRVSESEDMYGMVFQIQEQKLLDSGVSYDEAHASALATSILLGMVVESPFGVWGKKPLKEAAEQALKAGLERELGQELPQELLERIAREADRISVLPKGESRESVIREFIEKVKSEPLPVAKIDEAVPKYIDWISSGSKGKVEWNKVIDEAEEVSAVIPQTIKEFNALPDEAQEAAFSKLTPELKQKIFLGEEPLDVVGSPVDQLAKEIVDGSVKIRIPKSGKEDIRAVIGSGRYTRIFRSDSTLSPLDELATSVGVSDNELLDAIARAGKEKTIRPKSSGVKSVTPPSEIRKGLVRSTEERAEQVLSKVPEKHKKEVSSLPKIVDRSVTDVKQKINLIDYVRTPEKVLKKIGFENEAKLLRSGYEAYVKELPKNIDKITAWSKRVGKESNEKIFQFLDGKKVELDENELVVAGEIQTWLKEWADRLGLPEDNRIASYITHLFDEELLGKEFDEDLAKIIANKIPGEVYDPFLEKRLGARGYKQDTWGALDAYVKRGTRKVHMDEALSAIKTKAGKSLETSPLEQSQFEFLKRYIDNVNLRPTKVDNMIDNTVKSVVGYKFGQRPVTRVTKTLRQMTYRGFLGLNPGSALRNLSQGINTYAVLGEKYTTIGYASLFKSGAIDEIKSAGILMDNFIQDRTLSSTKKAMEKLDKVLFSFFETAERINRGAAYFGAKAKYLAEHTKKVNKGVDLVEENLEQNAIEYAKEIVRKTQFSFGSIDTPVGLQSDLVKTLTQFQTFTVKQVEFLSEMAMDKNFIGLIRYAVAGIAFVYTIGQAFGMDLDDLIPSFRLGTPPALKLPIETTKALLNAPDEYGQERDLQTKVEDVAEAGIGLIPAGIQAKKTIQGAQAINEGGSFDKAGSLQFEVGKSLPERLQVLLFGKYATESSEDYFNRFKIKEKQVKKIKPIYDQAQELASQGREDEAKALVDGLSEEDYGVYKAIKSDEKRKRTIELKKEMLPVVQKNLQLIAEGNTTEAQRIVDELTEEQYKVYREIKDALN